MKENPSPFAALLILSLLGLLVFSFNLFIPRHEPFLLYDSKRLFIILILSLSMLLCCFSKQTSIAIHYEYKHLQTHNRILLITFLVFTLLATAFGKYQPAATLQLLYMLGLFILAVQLKQTIYSQKLRVLQYLMWMSVFLMLSVFAGYWTWLAHGLPVNIHSMFGFVNARFINQIHVWLVIPIAYLALIKLRRKQRSWPERLLLVLCFTVIVATDARGEAISVIGAFVLLMVINHSNRHFWWRLLWQSTIAGITLKLLILSPMPSFILGIPAEWHTIRTGSSGRVQIWLETWEMSTFWGHGADAFVCDSEVFGRPHNFLLNILVHWGVIPAIAFIGAGFSILYQLPKVQKLSTLVFGVSLLSGLAYSLVSGVLDSPLSQLLAVISFALYWAHIAQRIPKNRQILPLGLPHRVTLCVLSILILSAINYRSYQRFANYPTLEQGDVPKTQFWLGYNCIETPLKP
ncbi:O-antigen ligase family protein [Vibrio sp. TBV020]|uniref:O-antigen ligase family protein n=1 Tax=Vibrio sp. TBV020 TaxID=3137398 RepID=UPI0038CDB95A